MPVPVELDLSGMSPREIIERAADSAREVLGMDMAYVADTHGGREAYFAVEGAGESFGARVGESVPLQGTYCQLLLEGRLPNLVPDSSQEPLVRDLPITAKAAIGSYVGVPITFADGRTFGTFCCLSHEPDPTLRARDVRFMALLGHLIADQLDHGEHERKSRRIEVTSGEVQALVAALEARDGYTDVHSKGVVKLAGRVARELGLPADQLTDVEHAALLHDIGKIGISDAVLRKPGPLSEDEWTEMRRHSAIGESIVAGMVAVAHLAPIVRAEHERWDGTGYPDGLRAEEIPLTSRIVFVCDAFHAMTSDRPYRKALSPKAALQELQRHSGTQFCPRTVAAAVSVLSSNGERTR